MCDGDLDRSGRYSVTEFRDSRYSPYLGGVMSVSRYLALSDVVIALGGDYLGDRNLDASSSLAFVSLALCRGCARVLSLSLGS